jgi:glucosamine kinase
VKKQVLIGESGGSKTDWAFIEGKEVKWRFSSNSLHPKSWKTGMFNELLCDFIGKQVDFQNTKLLFFGAGCNGTDKSDTLKNYLRLFGFNDIEISGDLRAAGLATIGLSDGFVAILGSGSVFIYFRNGEVVNFYGGLGREVGDEGAGFYFGKLVLNAYSNKELDTIQESILKSVLTVQERDSLDKSQIDEQLCLELPEKLSDKILEFENFHLRNIDLFHSKYVKNHVVEGSIIHFVGSYAFFHQKIIRTYFEAKGFEVGKIIARPIEDLIEFYKTRS